MSEHMYQSALHPAGGRSWRRFTHSEIKAAKRLDMCRGDVDKNLDGALFWATGDAYPNELERRIKQSKQRIRDCELILAALKREGMTPPDDWGTDD